MSDSVKVHCTVGNTGGKKSSPGPRRVGKREREREKWKKANFHFHSCAVMKISLTPGNAWYAHGPLPPSNLAYCQERKKRERDGRGYTTNIYCIPTARGQPSRPTAKQLDRCLSIVFFLFRSSKSLHPLGVNVIEWLSRSRRSRNRRQQETWPSLAGGSSCSGCWVRSAAHRILRSF